YSEIWRWPPSCSMTFSVAPIGSQMLMTSCRVTLTLVTVTVACVASDRRDSPATLARDTKLESQAAISPGTRGGMSAGGALGSKVWFATTTGCLLMVGARAFLSCGRDEKSR